MGFLAGVVQSRKAPTARTGLKSPAVPSALGVSSPPLVHDAFSVSDKPISDKAVSDTGNFDNKTINTPKNSGKPRPKQNKTNNVATKHHDTLDLVAAHAESGPDSTRFLSSHADYPQPTNTDKLSSSQRPQVHQTVSSRQTQHASSSRVNEQVTDGLGTDGLGTKKSALTTPMSTQSKDQTDTVAGVQDKQDQMQKKALQAARQEHDAVATLKDKAIKKAIEKASHSDDSGLYADSLDAVGAQPMSEHTATNTAQDELPLSPSRLAKTAQQEAALAQHGLPSLANKNSQQSPSRESLASPRVTIGQVNVVVETQQVSTAAPAHKNNSDMASRLFLRSL